MISLEARQNPVSVTDERIASLTMVVSEAVKRVAKNSLDTRDPYHRLLLAMRNDAFSFRFDGGGHLFVTDQPEKIYPQSPLYHQTSGLALRDLTRGKPLYPPVLHPQEQILTHRGWVMEWYRRRLACYEAPLGGSALAVWLATKVDDPKNDIEHQHVRDGRYHIPRIEELTNFENWLINLLATLKDRGYSDKQLLLTGICFELFFLNQMMGVRGNWLASAIEGTLSSLQKSGKTPDQYEVEFKSWLTAFLHDNDMIENHSGNYFKEIPSEVDDWAFPVVLTIDPGRLYRHLPFPVFFTSRDPNEIIPAFALTPEEITGVSFPRGIPSHLRSAVTQLLENMGWQKESYDSIPKLPENVPRRKTASPEFKLLADTLFLLAPSSEPACAGRYNLKEPYLARKDLQKMTWSLYWEKFSLGLIAPVLPWQVGRSQDEDPDPLRSTLFSWFGDNWPASLIPEKLMIGEKLKEQFQPGVLECCVIVS